MKPVVALACLLSLAISSTTRAEDAQSAPEAQSVVKRADAAALLEQIVRMFTAELQPEENGSFAHAELVVTELQIDGLWDTLGIQIFELTSGPDGGHEILTYAYGDLKRLPIHADHGVPNAVVSDGSLYFTCESGSGISSTTLHKLSRGQDKALAHETLGIIKANPAEHADKDVAKKMKTVIGKLKPVKNGASAKPATAPIDLDRIKGKIRVKRGEEITVRMKADGDRLLPRASGEPADPKDIVVRIAIKETTATPFPVQGDATRPYLAMANGTDRPLQFRLLTRLKGRNEYCEEDRPGGPVNPGEMIAVKCWESGSLVEEVVLHQFSLVPKAPGTPHAQ